MEWEAQHRYPSGKAAAGRRARSGNMAEMNSVQQGGMSNEGEVVRRTGRVAIADFFRSKTLYDVQRQSGKVVVFDTNIPIQLAFYALLEHGKRGFAASCTARRAPGRF